MATTDSQETAREFLERIEPHIHGVIKRHAPGFRDDGIVTRYTGSNIHKFIQLKPDSRGFWEECLGCTAKSILTKSTE